MSIKHENYFLFLYYSYDKKIISKNGFYQQKIYVFIYLYLYNKLITINKLFIFNFRYS